MSAASVRLLGEFSFLEERPGILRVDRRKRVIVGRNRQPTEFEPDLPSTRHSRIAGVQEDRDRALDLAPIGPGDPQRHSFCNNFGSVEGTGLDECAQYRAT